MQGLANLIHASSNVSTRTVEVSVGFFLHGAFLQDEQTTGTLCQKQVN